MERINYVIATYAGKGTKAHIEPKEKALKIHCQRLSMFKNNLKSITIMRANDEKTKDPNNVYAGYYDIEEYTKNIKPSPRIIDCENYCYSFGQWLYCYEQTIGQYDYYIFQEDDYVPNVDNFDTLYMYAYKEKFPDGIGLLCGMLLGIPNRLSHIPLHVSAPIIVSSKTLKMVYESHMWNRNPRKVLSAIHICNELFTQKETKTFAKYKQGTGAYYQIGFSMLFSKIGIPCNDILEKGDTIFLYWDDKTKLIYLYTYEKGKIPLKSKDFKKLKSKTYFLPFQRERLN